MCVTEKDAGFLCVLPHISQSLSFGFKLTRLKMNSPLSKYVILYHNTDIYLGIRKAAEQLLLCKIKRTRMSVLANP